MDIVHTAIDVSDLEETKAFYIDVLGLEHSWDFVLNGVQNFYVTGEGPGEIQFRYDPDRDAPVEPAGIDHIAITVDDVDETVEYLAEETDYPVHMEPTDVPDANARVSFVGAPDGYKLEIFEPWD